METKPQQCCPNCSQLYHIKAPQQLKGSSNLPLFLTCGHTMCESCILNILKFEEPVECKICHRDVQLSPTELADLNQKKIKLYQLLPVNLTLLGELALELIQQRENHSKKDENYFVDVQAIIKSTEITKGKCVECQNQTTKMCQQCATILCDTCFNKSHKNFVIFKNHVLKNIEHVTLDSNNCKVHLGKTLDYYCEDCKKPICLDCLMVGGEKSCKKHNVLSMQEINNRFLEDIIDLTPKVDETFKRLTKTSVDVGHLLHNVENETGSTSELTQILASVKQHFSKLTAAIQKHEQEVVNIIMQLKNSEQESLRKARDNLAKSIKESKTVLNTINKSTDPQKAKDINLAVLLDEAKKIVETPWYLCKDESNDPLKVAVNEDLCALVTDYIHLEGNASSVYKLRSVSELGEETEIPPPPTAPVFPPELPKDVRQSSQQPERGPAKSHQGFFQNAPKYRNKSGSVSSLNSAQSDGSERNNYYNCENFRSYQRPVVQPVPPFPESQHPKQLHEGAQELIYVSHIVDPHNFFVQRACHQGLVKEMLREFRNAANLPKPSLNHVAERKVYLMYNKADNMWQRCRIVSINRKNVNNPTFLVFCIDFGSTETVTIDKLRLLPPARVHSPYPLAVNCALFNCEPRSAAWTSDDAYLIRNIIDDKQAIIHVRAIRSTSEGSMTLECDVTTFEDGTSLVHALVFHERARMPNPKLKYPKMTGNMEKPKIFMNSDLKPKAVEEVYITNIISPDKFYVRKSYLSRVYEQMCEDLEEEYSGSTGRVYLPEIGMSYVVNLEKSAESGAGGWARAVAAELPGRGTVRVELPDVGGAALLHWTKLRHIHPRFTTFNALAIECHLAGVTPLNKKWSSGSVALLARFQGRALELRVEDARRGAPGVTLYDHADPDNVVCVNTEMIKHKFAVTFGLFTFNKNIVEDQVHTNKSPLDPPKVHPRPAGQIQILKKDQKPKNINEKELDAKDKGPLRLEAKVLHYHSPSLIYMAIVHQQKMFNELYEEIQKHYSKKKSQGKQDWAVGDRCCAICTQSLTWRRAVIVEINGDNAKVFYSDFACVETVPIAGLRVLAPEFLSVGDAAIKCHLCGIVPADGSEEWPTITKEYLKELLDAYPRVFITKLGNFKEKSMPVEVWVYHTIQGGALEPNKSEWRCLNKKIVEQGLGIPDKAQQATPSTETSKDDMLSFLKNVTGSVDEYLQLEPLPMKSMAKDEPPSPCKSCPEDDDRPSAAADTSNTVFISDWLPPEPLQSKQFTAMPTYIDNDGVVYLHDVTQQDTLDLIRKALDVRFKSPDPKAKYTKWSVGEPCIAQFFLDSRFYRGRILEVNDNNTCLIHYVDYGNEELCAFENLRKSIVLYQIPIQAHRCVLDKIRPVGTHWDRQTLDYIHKSIVEKQCFVKVTGEPIDGILPIELKYDKLWINDHLVDFEMAVYKDGSKAVVRKYAGGKKTKVPEPIIVDIASEPDYIVEEDDTISQLSFKSIEGKDWNKLIEEEENSNKQCIMYPSNDLDEFKCTISIINDVQILELMLVHSVEVNVLYEEMYETIQREGSSMPPLDGIFENKACIALFREDDQWYRATILQHSEEKACVKVRYVDYGNVEIVPLDDVREISPSWAELPPASVAARLSGVRVNPDVDVLTISQHYTETFLDKPPFHAKVLSYDGSVPNVELRNEDGELVYEKLIQDDVFLKCDTPTVD